MKPRVRLIVMATFVAAAKALPFPPNGGPSFSILDPRYIAVMTAFYLPVALVPAVVMPITLFEQRFSSKKLIHTVLLVAPLAAVVATLELYALNVAARDNAVPITVRSVTDMGVTVTLFFLIMVLRYQHKPPANA